MTGGDVHEVTVNTIERIVSPDGTISFRELADGRRALAVQGRGEVALTKRQLEWIVVEGMQQVATMTVPLPKEGEPDESHSTCVGPTANVEPNISLVDRRFACITVK